MDQGYDCQLTNWPSKYKRKRTSCCDKPCHTNKGSTERGGNIFAEWGIVSHGHIGLISTAFLCIKDVL